MKDNVTTVLVIVEPQVTNCEYRDEMNTKALKPNVEVQFYKLHNLILQGKKLCAVVGYWVNQGCGLHDPKSCQCMQPFWYLVTGWARNLDLNREGRIQHIEVIAHSGRILSYMIQVRTCDTGELQLRVADQVTWFCMGLWIQKERGKRAVWLLPTWWWSVQKKGIAWVTSFC